MTDAGAGTIAIAAGNISKRYRETVALDQMTLAVNAGETVAIVGPSGSGKTTLLHLLAGNLATDTGSIALNGRALAALQPGREKARLVGIMHQGNDLVANLPVVHNVLAGRLGEWGLLRSLVSLVIPREREIALRALDRVGIGDKLSERTSRLSGGEQQRVALARLLIQNPAIIIADEPVSSLDPIRAEDVIRILVEIASDESRTLVASLHSVPLALQYFSRIIALRNGRVLFDRPAADVHPIHLDRLYAYDDEGPRIAVVE